MTYFDIVHLATGTVIKRFVTEADAIQFLLSCPDSSYVMIRVKK